MLSKRAELTPTREALCELATGRRFTYGELEERAGRAAAFLQERCGVRAGDRVSILAHNSVVYLDLFFGLERLGAVFAPLNWRLSAAELVYIVQDCQPRVVLVGPEFASVWEEVVRDAPVETVVALEGAQLDGALCYEEELAAVPEPLPGPQTEMDDETPLCILYTSGTTGQPKGAIIPRRQVLWNCINTVISWGLTEGDVTPIFTPAFHSGGLFAFMMPVLYVGGRVLLAREFDAEASLRTIEEERCTVILGVPTIFQMWRATAIYHEVDFSHVRFFISGGAPCPPSLIRTWREEKGVVFRQGYGLTEVGPNCFSMTDEESALKTGSVGKPIFHSYMRLVGEDGQVVTGGDVGELLIRGPHVCSGYWGNPEATAEALQDGWFHTGDMARHDKDGFYYIVGRFKDMIISGGENVYAAEVEAIFREHPAVQEAALIGKPDAVWGEVGLLFVVLAPDAQADAETLIDFCRTRLARYKVPKEVRFVDNLPYSPYGKVEKERLKKLSGVSSQRSVTDR